MLASEVKALTYYSAPAGHVFVSGVTPIGMQLAISQCGYSEGEWTWIGEFHFWPSHELSWTEIQRPLDSCPADPGAPRVPRLVWRTVGRTKALIEVERGTEEAGDEPFAFGGLNA